MLANLHVPWVILGHSERRQLCGETDAVSVVEFLVDISTPTKMYIDTHLSIMIYFTRIEQCLVTL